VAQSGHAMRISARVLNRVARFFLLIQEERIAGLATNIPVELERIPSQVTRVSSLVSLGWGSNLGRFRARRTLSLFNHTWHGSSLDQSRN